MIAPESERGGKSHGQTSREVLLRNNLAVSALIFALLQIWRPCFFLTDDNLDGGFPIFTEMGLRMLHGQSPYVSQYLFGGDYPLLRDPTFFLWHPVYLLSSLLAGTPLRFLIIDTAAFAFFMLATAGFVNLAWYLRRELPLRLSDGWIMFYTMSFTYCVIILTLGASWLDYTANYGALPWLALGILQKKWRDGIGLVALFSIHHLLGGHPLADFSNTVFLSLFALGVSLWRRSWLPLCCWLAGYAVALVFIAPLFFPMLEGFLSSQRAQGVPLWDMQVNNIPPLLFPTSVFLGMALWYIHPPEHAHITYTLAFGACAAAWCLLPALSSRKPWRGLDLISLGLAFFAAFLICRPLWVTEIMAHLPFFRSMRWPFREMVQFQFFLHLFLLVRKPHVKPRVRRLTALLSASLLVPPLFLYVLPPTLNAMPMNRELLMSGDLDRYWDRVRPLFQPGDRFVVLLSYDLYVEDKIERPNSFLGSYNYACLARVVCASGYSHTVPAGRFPLKTEPYFPNGTYEISQRAALVREDPHLKLITLESVEPLRITLSSGDGPVIDLSPFIPDRAGKTAGR